MFLMKQVLSVLVPMVVLGVVSRFFKDLDGDDAEGYSFD